jgi:saccharopine dehydrogenase-like NADP-dependent oxidoreductase
MKQYDVGVNTLPDRRTSYKTVHAAVECGFHLVDMLEEYHFRPDLYETEGLELPPGTTLEKYGDWLHETALKNGVCFMDGIGFAPGLSNVTCGEGIRKLDEAESVIARVGGIPRKDVAAKAIGAVLIGKGLIKERGIVAPEDCTSSRPSRRFRSPPVAEPRLPGAVLDAAPRGRAAGAG